MTDLRFGRYPLDRVRRGALIAAAVFIVFCIIGWIFKSDSFYRAYLTAWLFWLNVSIGSLLIIMLHNLTGGGWGIAVRRLAEHAAMVLPLLLVLFIPIAIGMDSLYPWADAHIARIDPAIAHKAGYLNPEFILLRAAVFFALWIAIAWFLRRGSLRDDLALDLGARRRMHNVSAGGMALMFLTMSFASVDWIMSRDPHWYSTIFPLIVIQGQSISGICFAIIVLVLIAEALPARVEPDHLNDLGNLLLACVILWAYLSFAQFLVIWMGNKQDEITWYAQRLSGGWRWIGLSLIVLHFFVPFIVLLMREAKRRMQGMLLLCTVLFVLRYVDVFWLVVPSGNHSGASAGFMGMTLATLMYVIFPIGMGGIWLLAYLWLLAGHPLVVRSEVTPVVEAHAG